MNLPAEFIERTRQLLGDGEWERLSEALRREAPASVRMNVRKCSSVPDGALPVPWCKAGFYLSARPAFTFDPLFHAGCYYVQEASSMFLDRVMSRYVASPSVMLDLCAAPGGKSTLARAALPEGSLLVANEVMPNRSQVLAENIVKWGHPDVVVTNNDPADFAEAGMEFDVILADVPCSGEGMFRKDATAVSEWSIDNVSLCRQRQRRILGDVWPCLKPGGILIYSTCTYNREENEDNVAWIAETLGAEALPVDVEPGWAVTGNLGGGTFPVYRFLPHRTEGEGLFMAVLRKTSDDGGEGELGARKRGKRHKDKAKKAGRNPLKIPREMEGWLLHSGRYSLSIEKESIAVAFPAAFKSVYEQAMSGLKVVHAGVVLGEWKGKDWQPNHSLAMSADCNAAMFPQAEVTYKQAVAYLRKEALSLPGDMPRGYVLVAFHGHPLGFVKNVGNRANNLYPQEWRIRSGYLPEEEVRVIE